MSVRGNVSEQGAPRFFRRLAEGVFDLPDLHRRTEELASFLSAAADRYAIAAGSLYAVGYSNGANIAASLLLSGSGLLTGGVLFRAMVPFEPTTLPDLGRVAVLVSEGRHDPIIEPAHGERLAELFGAAGADVTLAWQQSGHNLTSGDVATGQRWLSARVHPGN